MHNSLDAERIINALERQQKILNLSRLDLCSLTGIPYTTITSSLQKGTLLRFNDLYLLSLAIGMPINELLNPENKTDPSRKDNILYWHRYMPDGCMKRYLALFPDKVALAKAFLPLMENVNPLTLFLPPRSISKTIDDLRACIFFHLLCMEDVFSAFYISRMVDEINRFYSIQSEDPLTIIDYFQTQKQITASLWGFPFLAVQKLWEAIDEIIQTKYSSLSAFLKEAGINAVAYSRYLHACSEKSSPSTETVYRVCSMLGIDDIDALIRSKLPPVIGKISITSQKAGILPHRIEFDTLAENLKSLPYFALFMDSFFSLGYDTLLKIYDQIQGMAFRKENSLKAVQKPTLNLSYVSSEDYYYDLSLFLDKGIKEDYADLLTGSIQRESRS